MSDTEDVGVPVPETDAEQAAELSRGQKAAATHAANKAAAEASAAPAADVPPLCSECPHPAAEDVQVSSCVHGHWWYKLGKLVGWTPADESERPV